MTFAEGIWRGSIAARTNVITAASYSAAFCGNAALQSWQLGVNAPLSFWRAVARAAQGPAARDDARPGTGDAAPEEAAPENVVELQPAPAAEPEAEAAIPDAAPNPALLDAPRDGQGDDLRAVRGIGAKLADSLNEIGIYHYDQLAALDAEAIDWLDEHIEGFKRSCARFDIVAGAAGLA